MSGYYHPQYPNGYYSQQQHPQQQHPQAAYHAQPVYQHATATPWPAGSQYAAHPGSATPAPQWPQQAAGHYASAYSQQMHLNQGYSAQPYVDPRMSMHGYMAQQTALPPQPVTPASYPPQAYPQTVMTPVQTVVSQPWGQHIPNGSAIPAPAPVTTAPVSQPTTSSPKRPLPSPAGSRPRPESIPPNSHPVVSAISNPSHSRTPSASQAPATTNSAFPRSSFDGINTSTNIKSRWQSSAPSTSAPKTTSVNTSKPSIVSKGDESDGGKRPLPVLPPSVFGVRADRRGDDTGLPASPRSSATEAAVHTQLSERDIPSAGSSSRPPSLVTTPSPNPTKRSLPTAPGGGGIQPGTVLPRSPAGPSRSTTFPNATTYQSPSPIPSTSSLPAALSRGSSSGPPTTPVTSEDDKRPLWRRMAAAAGDPRTQGSSLSSRSITPSSRVERTSPKPPPAGLPKEAPQTYSQIQPQHQRTPSLPSTVQPVVPAATKSASAVSSQSRQATLPQPPTSRPTSVVAPTSHAHQRTSSVPAPATATARPRKDRAQGEEGGQARVSMFMKRASMSLQEHKNEDWAKWAMKSVAPTSPRASPRSGPTARPTSVGSASDLDLDDAPPQAIHRGSFGKVSSGSKSHVSAPQRQVPSPARVAHQKRASSNDADRAPYPTYKPSYSDSEGEEENTHPQIVVSTAVPQISVHSAADDRAPRKDVTPPRQPPASPKAPAISVTVEKPKRKGPAPAPPPVVPSFSFSVDGEDDEAVPQHKEKPLPPKVKKGSSRCGACEKAILGRIINAMGARWHPECFRCSVCDTGLEHISSYEHDDRPYCHLCYHEVRLSLTLSRGRQPDSTFSCLLLGATIAKPLSWRSTSSP